MVIRSVADLQESSGTARRPIVLLAVELMVGVNAIAGGAGLVINGLGMSRDQLAGSPFDSYAIPGLVLAVVVGGATVGAGWAVWTRQRFAPMASLGAGAVVIGWILVQLVMLGFISVLQPVILAVGLTIFVLAWTWMRATREPNVPPTRP